jgi:hypothetical protein
MYQLYYYNLHIEMSSARVTGCSRTRIFCRTFGLQILNLIDILLGGFLIGLGIYLRLKVGESFFQDEHTGWLALSTEVMGVLMLLVSLTSLLAIMNSGRNTAFFSHPFPLLNMNSIGCRWMAYPSGYLALIEAILALSLGIAALSLQDSVLSYLDENGEDMGLSDEDLSLLETWYNIIAYGMFGLCVLEIVRFRFSMRYRADALRLDGEFDALLAEDQKNWNQKIHTNQVAREGKYDDLRAYYKAKYAASPMDSNS